MTGKRFCLHTSATVAQDNNLNCINIYWNLRDVPQGSISLPKEVDRLLLQIRAEHMRWAYEVGFLAAGKNGVTLSKALECGDSLSMWWTSLLYERHPKMSPQLYDIYRLRALELLLVSADAQGLQLYGNDKLLAQTLASLCSELGLEFSESAENTEKNIAPKGLKARIYEKIPAPARALIRYAHWYWKIRRFLPFASKKLAALAKRDSSLPLPATITTYFPNIDLQAAAGGRFRSRYWEDLHELLNRKAKAESPNGPHFVNWIFIHFPSPQLNFSQCLELRKVFEKNGHDGATFTYLEEFLSTSDLFKGLRRWLSLCLQSYSLQNTFANACHFENSKLNFWGYMAGQWAESLRGWRCLERCLQNLAFEHYYAHVGKQRWNLFPLENCPWERMLTQAARDNDRGPVYGAQHSIIRPTDFRYFDDSRTFTTSTCRNFQPDIVAGNGASAIRQWRANAMPNTVLRQIEALRYLYLEKIMGRAKAEPPDKLLPETGLPLADTTKKRLLVLTSFFADETAAHLDLLGKALDAGLLENWNIVLKPHPYLSVQDWLAARTEKQRRQIRLSDAPITMELKPDVTVWASNSTTAALEAALYGLPVMVMQPANDFDLCPIQNVPGLARTGNLDDLRQCLDKLAPLELGDYLDINPQLPAWRELLQLD